MHRNENYLRGQFGKEGKRSNALARNGVRFTQKINCNQFSVSKEYFSCVLQFGFNAITISSILFKVLQACEGQNVKIAVPLLAFSSAVRRC